MRTPLALFALLALGGPALAQRGPVPDQVIDAAEQNGIEVRIKDIARLRGIRGNQLLGYGLVVGLEGTGDTRRTPFTNTLLANAMRRFGTIVDPANLNAKNVATVAITAELPPFAAPGNAIDVTVQSIGDAQSLQGGYLLQAPLFGANDGQQAIVVAQGPVSIGGFNFGAGGTRVQRNHVNVGRIPGGGIVERAVPFQLVFPGGRLYLELDDGDFTTAQRVAAAIGEAIPDLSPRAQDGGTIELRLPEGADPVATIAKIESLRIFADIPAVVVVNERTGTIVIGGNVRIGPAVVAQGNLQVVIERTPVISQPNPLAGGETVRDEVHTVTVEEERAQIGVVGPNATVSDLGRIFQALRVSPRDIVAILDALRQQGALKARVRMQ
jgi:flagellar P-ring protein precursor FlgI